ncbi:Ltp family lipoprotein [Micromonospora sp. DT81.3]|uniref:Ltp family lipoprotein n=1 Tax=Micromonospora sp. DT81.3 TaxID=3416523 RepID=UPI003CF4ACC7
MGSTQDRHPIGHHPPAAGWYPDAQVAGQIRYFDGRSWTQHTAPAIRSLDVANAAAAPKTKRQTGLWIMLGVTAALVALVFALRVANLGSNDGAAGDTAAQAPVAEAPAVVEEQAAESADESPAEPEAPAASGLTLAQQNAVERARGYLDMMGFSRSDLIGQLEYEGFTVEDATLAVDRLAPDWNAEAVEAARGFLDVSSFTRDTLLDALLYRGFSQSEAEAGLAAVGY